jgi:hypothetical protein
MGGRTRTSGQGRPKGVPNKTTVAAREAFQLAFEGLGGVTALQVWANDNQTEFFKLYGRLIPVDVNASGGLTINIKRFGDGN